MQEPMGSPMLVVISYLESRPLTVGEGLAGHVAAGNLSAVYGLGELDRAGGDC
jgi:hypothetical protein